MAPLEKISGLTPLMNMADEFCYEENRANAPLDMVNFATKKAGLTPFEYYRNYLLRRLQGYALKTTTIR